MSHKTRHEQKAQPVQKDRNKLAKRTKVHKPKSAYKRVRDVLGEFYEDVG